MSFTPFGSLQKSFFFSLHPFISVMNQPVDNNPRLLKRSSSKDESKSHDKKAIGDQEQEQHHQQEEKASTDSKELHDGHSLSHASQVATPPSTPPWSSDSMDVHHDVEHSSVSHGHSQLALHTSSGESQKQQAEEHSAISLPQISGVTPADHGQSSSSVRAYHNCFLRHH